MKNATISFGEVIPPYVLVAEKLHFESWYYDSPFLPEWTTDLLETGWMTKKIGLD